MRNQDKDIRNYFKTMDELIKTFHIDIKLLLAQTVNFGIVVFVLYKFAYKPLLKHMSDRSSVIEKGLDDAKEAQNQLEKAEKTKEDKIQQAKLQARKILEQARYQVEKNKELAVAEARKEAKKVIAQAKVQLSSEKEKMLIETKSEIGNLVALATEKIVKKKMDQQINNELVEDVVRNIK